jgi:hypothetical protein
MKITSVFVATAVFALTVIGVYFTHVNFFPVNVVFYSAMLDGLIAIVFASIVFVFFKILHPLTGLEKALLVALWIVSSYAVAISVPTVIDRSLSFYILEKMQQRGGGVKLGSFNDIFTKEYVIEHRLMDVRLTEQVESGTIVIDDGCVLLTPRGERIAQFGRYFRTNWLPKKRLLMGQYTDALTDPFRSSVPDPGYSCE